MKIEEIKELMNEVKKLNLSGFKYTNNAIEINIENNTSVAFDTNQLPADYHSNIGTELICEEKDTREKICGETVNSPIVGVFYKSSSPDSDPYVSAGQVLKKGSTLCIIEAMKVMNEITAEYDMKIISVDVNDGEMVEFNQNIFTVERV